MYHRGAVPFGEATPDGTVGEPAEAKRREFIALGWARR